MRQVVVLGVGLAVVALVAGLKTWTAPEPTDALPAYGSHTASLRNLVVSRTAAPAPEVADKAADGFAATAAPPVLIAPDPSLEKPVAALHFTPGSGEKNLNVSPGAVGGVVVVEQGFRITLTEDTPDATARKWTLLQNGEAVAVDNTVFRWVGYEGANPLSTAATPNSVQLVIYETGDYTIQVTVTSPEGGDGQTFTQDITVAEYDEPVAASMDVGNILRNQEGLIPLNDWAPLFLVTLTGQTDTNKGDAVRVLGKLDYRIVADASDPLPFELDNRPQLEEIYQFGLFRDSSGNGEPDGVFNTQYDVGPLHVWDNTGDPYGTVTDTGTSLDYALDFYTEGYLTDGVLTNWPYVIGDTTNQYIVAVRTSSVWRNGTALNYDLTFGTIVAPTVDPRKVDGLGRPLDKDGAVLDSYPIDLTDPNAGSFLYVPAQAYYGCFTVWDQSGNRNGSAGSAPINQLAMTGAPVVNDARDENRWQYPTRLYTPQAEFIRPRFDGVTQAFDVVLGEWMQMRTLFSIESYVPVIGINIHKTQQPDGSGSEIRELNLIFTDIGGDPDNPTEGNGGFNAPTAFNPFTDQWNTDVNGNPNVAIGNDFALNGVWLFRDTNNNGAFDPPANIGTQVTFTDLPMFPDSTPSYPMLRDPYKPHWDYIANPPWGGDPAWKIKLRFIGGERRNLRTTKEVTGLIEPVPDKEQFVDSTDKEDYFVVVRGDSGYQDSALLPGDGVGMLPGTDFRAFIEPRRIDNTVQLYTGGGVGGYTFLQAGSWEGGMYVSGQIPYIGDVLGVDDQGRMQLADVWQNSPLWDVPRAGEPWWPERTLNPINAKPFRTTLDIHDLVMTYDSDNHWAVEAATSLGINGLGYWVGEGHAPVGSGYDYSQFALWMDPYGTIRDTFYYQQAVGTDTYGVAPIVTTILGVNIISTEDSSSLQIPYETAPFRIPNVDTTYSSRSQLYPASAMRPMPTLPSYETWPPQLSSLYALPDGRYPHISDWPKSQRAARLLTQKIPIDSEPTAMLGFNLTGVDDPAVNRIINGVQLQAITVAFWGPDFDPRTDLLPLDATGADANSGVLIYEDSGSGGALTGGVFAPLFDGDRPVPLRDLKWSSDAEPIDLDGDGVADDMDGDGIVTSADNAWVLRVIFRDPWRIPNNDLVSSAAPAPTTSTSSAKSASGEPSPTDAQSQEASTYSLNGTLTYSAPEDGIPVRITRDDQGNPVVERTVMTPKSLASAGHIGDDLYLVVRTSDKVKAFSSWRAVVPWSLPNRVQSDRDAGVRLDAGGLASVPASALKKLSVEENPVQDLYSHDMIEASVPTALVNMTEGLTDSQRRLSASGDPVAVLGLDTTTNRPDSILAQGTVGAPGAGKFTVDGAGWAVGAYVGEWLIDAEYHGFEISGNTGTELTLKYGTPAAGPWKIVHDPTFLEQLIVEFYDEGNDNEFDPTRSLLPMGIEDPSNGLTSGLSIYRDNDNDPRNTDGRFDPEIDIPIKLDQPPFPVGAVGEPKYMYMCVFSSPGTDALPTAQANQQNLRQWVPATWGGEGTAGSSPDFFVVVRVSALGKEGDDFRVGLVSWGPNTPTEPDPDTFAIPLPTAENRYQFDLFNEFPWGSRAVGYISFFKNPPVYYSLDGFKARRERDATGINWIRTTANVNRESNILTIEQPPPPLDITDVNRRLLPTVVQAPGLDLVITGVSFGTNAQVKINGQPVTVTSCKDDEIQATIPEGTTFTAGQSVVLVVTNPFTDQSDNWIDFEVVPAGQIRIDRAVPNVLDPVIPEGGTVVTLLGVGFGNAPEVTINGVDAEVISATDTAIVIRIPGGLELTDPVVVEVLNTTNNLSARRDDLFTVSFLTIDTGTPSTIPQYVPPSGLNITLTGEGFGTSPAVELGGLQLQIVSATDTKIVAKIPGNTIYAIGSLTVTVTNTLSGASASRGDLFRVVGQGAAPLPASIAITDLAGSKDQQSLLPLSDWVPLFRIVMSYPEDQPAPRVLKRLRYLIKEDPRAHDADPNSYGMIDGPSATDLLDFAVFQESGTDPAQDLIGTLDAEHDSILNASTSDPVVWDSYGAPLTTMTVDSLGQLVYDIDFIGSGTAASPQYPLVAAPGIGNSYIVAVRTSATWRSMLSMSYEVTAAEMVDSNGNFPRDPEDGTIVDSYDPDFYANPPATLAPTVGYSASFDVWDITGYAGDAFQPAFVNAWNWPHFTYTPTADHARPRWDTSTNVLEFVTGEMLNLRNVFSLESYDAVIGINVHSTQTVHTFDPDRTAYQPLTNFNPTPDRAQLREVNVVLTDIGADPDKDRGNGGLDAPEGFERFTRYNYPPDTGRIETPAYYPDFSFNGVWVWEDSNNNGVFDPPIANATGGLTYQGDFPMFPENWTNYTGGGGLYDSNAIQWGYVAFPPGGGDPWWTLKLRLYDGRRRSSADAADLGYVETTPDNLYASTDPAVSVGSEYTCDYFVVVHPDSGSEDASLGPADGQGMKPGADFRAFIEPRRYNPETNHWDGGIYVDSQIPGPGFDLGTYSSAWQDDPRWGDEEPWWNQRTVNAASTKPVRMNVDVHDLVMTYSSSSWFARDNTISLVREDLATDSICFGFSYPYTDPTWFDMWLDPFGIVQSQFLNRHGVATYFWFTRGQVSFTFAGLGTVNTIINDVRDYGQYAFETVPFYIPFVDGVQYGPRSDAYPIPPTQPTLPEYATWPPTLGPGEYPRLSDWAPKNRAARLLKQHIDITPDPTAMLGINLAGTNDPVTNDRNRMYLSEITVAFWGPNFTPSVLAPLDPDGEDPNSGVLLWEDADNDGTFLGQPFSDYVRGGLAWTDSDQAVPLDQLEWASKPEPIDLDGDGIPDDMNGDGLVTEADYAWVLKLHPKDLWPVPNLDSGPVTTGTSILGCSLAVIDSTGGEGEGEGEGETEGQEYVAFTVDSTAVGLVGTDVRSEEGTTTITADVFRGGAGTNVKHLGYEELGLVSGDEIVALSIRDSHTPFVQSQSDLDSLVWHFSVDPSSQGANDTAVQTAATSKSSAGSVFWTSPADGENSNSTALTERALGLANGTSSFSTSQDNITGLDLTDVQGGFPPQLLQALPANATVYFCLGPDSPSLANGATYSPGAIFYSTGDGEFRLFKTAEQLGLKSGTAREQFKDGDQIDGLFINNDADRTPFFSVGRAGASGLAPAGIYTLDDRFTTDAGTAPDEVVKPGQLGLLDTDNIDGLDALRAKFVFGAGASNAKSGQTLQAKALAADTPQPGDDLFIAVKPSDTAGAFSAFRAVIPASLPARTASARQAGIVLSPTGPVDSGALEKLSPEEGPVQEFYGYDMLEFNVPTRIDDLTTSGQKIVQGGSPLATMGLDISTNRPEARLASGTNGVGALNHFTVSNASWTAGQFVGGWLIDKTRTAYEIVGNTSKQLALRSGTPSDGEWQIVSDATFLEQVIVEFYYNNTDATTGEGTAQQTFDVNYDLMPLSADQRVSGVAIYRDNDGDPRNHNGVFDPDIDIPLQLDATPTFYSPSGTASARVHFVFSSPGTDGLPSAIANQPIRRQWVPLTWGTGGGDPNSGPEFFIVVRPSKKLKLDDSFSMGIVAWGPNTPTEPDPDTFINEVSPLTEMKEFREFPYASRGVGYISFFKDPPVYYNLEGTKAKTYTDTSGYNWIRSSADKHRRTRVITAQDRILGPDAVIIDSASKTELPATILSTDPFNVVIRGQGFGTSPQVTVGGYDVTVLTATNESVEIALRNRDGVIPEDPAVLIITNPSTKQQDSRDDLFSVVGTVIDGRNMSITRVSPSRGSDKDFPVTITGVNLGTTVQVYFGQTEVPVRDVDAAGTTIRVDFPVGGLPQTGPLDVTVRKLEPFTKQPMDEVTKVNGFTYINNPVGPCFIATAAFGSPLDRHLDTFRAFRDGVLLTSAPGAALVDVYYSTSPGIADAVAVHPALAMLVRVVLLPVAWLLECSLALKLLLAAGLLLIAGQAYGRRVIRRRRQG